MFGTGRFGLFSTFDGSVVDASRYKLKVTTIFKIDIAIKASLIRKYSEVEELAELSSDLPVKTCL
jgi:hypothetical protein